MADDSTDKCPLCDLPPDECGCFEPLNGDTSEPIPEGSLAEMLEELEHEEQP